MAIERVVFSGFGGQGLLFIGRIFATLQLRYFPYVTFFPSYGSEVRGGTANCQVIVSDEEIASPLVEEADSLILMNQPSVERFLPILKQDGLTLLSSPMAEAPDQPNALSVPAMDLAREAGGIRAANVVMLAGYLSRRRFFGYDEAANGVVAASSSKGKKAEELNRNAFAAGWAFAQT